jgi:hypothetical protein
MLGPDTASAPVCQQAIIMRIPLHGHSFESYPTARCGELRHKIMVHAALRYIAGNDWAGLCCLEHALDGAWLSAVLIAGLVHKGQLLLAELAHRLCGWC